MTSELEAALAEGEHMTRLRQWRTEALEKHHCMSEWQITACLLLERHDRLRAALRVATAQFVAAEHLVALLEFPMIQLTKDEDRALREAYDDFKGAEAVLAALKGER